MTDFANIAAAQSAGYTYETGTSGPGTTVSPVYYVSTLTKALKGETGEADVEFTATGSDPTSQANADAIALAALNAQRSERYGYGEPAPDDVDDQGNPLTVDVS